MIKNLFKTLLVITGIGMALDLIVRSGGTIAATLFSLLGIFTLPFRVAWSLITHFKGGYGLHSWLDNRRMQRREFIRRMRRADRRDSHFHDRGVARVMWAVNNGELVLMNIEHVRDFDGQQFFVNGGSSQG